MRTDRGGLAAAVLVAWLGAGAAEAAPAWATTPAFQVAVSLSPKAAARLAHPHETIIVAAYVYGDANDRGQRLADEVGQIDFGREQKVELPGPGVARFQGVRYDTKRLVYVDGKLQVLVNVYSGRRSSPDNLLDCSIFQDSVELAGRAVIPIRCKLIGEP
ncbi:MAG: hypothetical protein P4L73_13535 [Caulobacteraceae bacterium]|nr:hypothetical protein [Caulobacteraceae bacterium]